MIRSVRYSFVRVPSGPISAFIDFARFGQSLGFDRFWIPDQTYYPDPFALLATISTAVSDLELGLAVTNPYTRHPVQIARAATTIAEMTGGRFLLGLGAGNRENVLHRLAISGRQPSERLREATLLIRRLIHGDTVDHEGFWTLRGIRLEREPVSLDIPILIGTRNPRTLRVAGEVADGVMLESLVLPESQAYGLEEVGKGALSLGRSLVDMEIVAWQSVLVTDDFDHALQVLRPWVAYLLGMTTSTAAVRMGIKPEVVDRAHRAYAEGGTEATLRFVGKEEVDRFVIAGEPERVASRCLALVRGGATDIAVLVQAEDALGRETLRRFASEVRPHIEACLR
jgi:5,10-methylenetetrahydromethanopterin reductase